MCYFTRYLMSCCKSICKQQFDARFMAAIDTLGVTDTERAIIRDRYVEIVVSAESDYNRTTALFLFLTNLITIGGVLLIAFLPLEKGANVSETVANVFYWICWILSILVTVSNKTLYSFNIPRKYILNILTLEKYKSEGWSFIEGIGKYRTCGNIHDRVRMFCTRVERIKLRSLELMANVEASGIEKMQEGNTSANANSKESTPFSTSNVNMVPVKPSGDVDNIEDGKNSFLYADSNMRNDIGSILAAGPNQPDKTTSTECTVIRVDS